MVRNADRSGKVGGAGLSLILIASDPSADTTHPPVQRCCTSATSSTLSMPVPCSRA